MPFVAGETLTAARMNLLLPTLVVKSTDQTVTNSTVPVNDTDFFFTLAANSNYKLIAALICTGPDGNNVGEINCRWTMPASCTIDWGMHSPTFGLASGQIGDGNWGAARDTTSPTVGAVLGTCVAATISTLSLGIRNGANAGSLQFQWTQNVANATGSTIRAGSFMLLVKQ